MAEDWRKRAACLGKEDQFFPDPSDRYAIRAAVAICAECPVKKQCQEFARTIRVRHGIWAGSLRDGAEEIAS